MKVKVTCNLIKPPYKFVCTNGSAFYEYSSAHTKLNPNWKWHKPWITRFLSIPAGYKLYVSISSKIQLDNKPEWPKSKQIN